MAALALLNGTEPAAAPAPAPAPAPCGASLMSGLSASMLGLGLGGGRCSMGGGGRASMDSSGEHTGRVSMGSVGSGTSSDSASSGTSLKRLGLSGAASRRVVNTTSEPAAAVPSDAAAKDRTDASAATPSVPAAAGKRGADGGVDALTAAMSGACLAPGVAVPPALDAIEEDSPSKEDLTPSQQAASRAALSPIAPAAAQQARGTTPRASNKTPRRGFGMPATPVHRRPARASEAAGPTPPVDGPMLAWWLVMASLPAEEALLLLPLVCRTMRAMGDDLALLASLVGSFFAPDASDGGAAKRAGGLGGQGGGGGGGGASSLVEMGEVLKAYPCGRYLAEGGCKQVYRVFNGSAQRWEAMSVVDRKAMREAGIEGQLQTEVWVSYLLSQLRRHGRCPHYLRLHQTFTCVEPPPGREWGDVDKPPVPAADDDDDGSSSSDENDEAAAPPPAAAGRAKPRKPAKVTRKPKAAQECHQYLLMELAEGGDMEEACKKQPGEAWEPAELPALLLQMLFSLHASQRELGMRHYDIKLLNFFLARPPPSSAADARALTMRYGVGGAHPLLQTQLPCDAPSMVVLADFGTADLAPETLGAPIGEQHFTTLENTPPDFLLCGSGARQGFAADAFGLGLCVLHLLTGRAPYEELTAPLHCPAELRQALRRVWSAEAAAGADGDPYAALRCHVEDEDEGEATLCDTLYRFLCLFGAELGGTDADEDAADDSERDTHACSGCVASSAAWAAVQSWLATSGGKTRFCRDHAQWSAFHGRSKVLAPAQKRMAALPGSEELLRGLVRFEPSRRWSVARALRSDFFAPLRCDAAASPAASETVLEYLQYQEA